jgi:hypothetical protein
MILDIVFGFVLATLDYLFQYCFALSTACSIRACPTGLALWMVTSMYGMLPS